MSLLLALATALALAAWLAVGEVLHRRGVPSQITRRVAHAGTGSTAALVPLYLRLSDVIVLGSLFTIVLVWTALRGSLASVHRVDRPTLGAVLFPVGAVLTAVLVWDSPTAFAYGMLVLALADPAAAVSGELLGGPGWRVWGGHKTLTGSVACFAVIALLGAIFTGLGGSAPGLAVVTVALALTATEASLGYGLDNLVLPLLAGILGRQYLGF